MRKLRGQQLQPYRMKAQSIQSKLCVLMSKDNMSLMQKRVMKPGEALLDQFYITWVVESMSWGHLKGPFDSERFLNILMIMCVMGLVYQNPLS